MWHNLYFNSILYIVGYLFLLFGFRVSLHMRSVLAFSGGITLWGILATFLLIVSFPMNRVNMLLACALVIVVAGFFRRRQGLLLEKTIIREVTCFLVYFCLFILVNIVVLRFGYMTVTPDSATFLGVGSILGKSGQLPPPGMPGDVFLSLMENCIGFLTLVIAGGYLFGVKFYNSVFPVSAFYFLPTFVLLFFFASEGLNLKRGIRLLLGGCGALMIVSVPAYWYHAYYVHQNLLTAIYYTIGILSVFIYRNQRERQWLALAAISLGVTALLRSEMLAFSVIPIVMLMSTPDLKRKDYGMFLFIFFCTFLPMQLLRSYYLGLGRHAHEWGLIQLSISFAYLLSYLIIHFDISKEKIALIAPNILICALIICILARLYYYHDETMKSIAGFLEITSISKRSRGGWGFIWLAIGSIIVVDVIVIGVQKALLFWRYILIMFFCMFILLFSLAGLFPPGRQVVFTGGDRILLHIMPIGVCYMFFLLAYVIPGLSWGKRQTLCN